MHVSFLILCLLLLTSVNNTYFWILSFSVVLNNYTLNLYHDFIENDLRWLVKWLSHIDIYIQAVIILAFRRVTSKILLYYSFRSSIIYLHHGSFLV